MYKSRFGSVPVVTLFLFLVGFAGAFANAQNITTVVGNGTAGYNGNSSALTLQLSAPSGVALDAAGDLFIADTGNCTVWELPSGQTVLTRFAGNPGSGYCTTNNSASQASELTLYNPAAVASCNGNVYIATHLKTVISGTAPYTFTYTPASLFQVGILSGAVTSLQMPGNNLGTNTGSPVYPDPQTLTCDANGNVYMQSLLGYGKDGPLCSLDKIPATGTPFNLILDYATFFSGVALVDSNNVEEVYTVYNPSEATTGYVLEYNASSSSGYIPVSPSRPFVNPSNIASDSKGMLYISEDTEPNAPKTLSNYISTLAPPSQTVAIIAGNSTAGFSGDGGLATSAQLNNPGGVAIDSAGDVFFADTGNNRIREIVAPVVVTCPAPPTFEPAGGTYSNAQSVTISEPDECTGTTIYFTTGLYQSETPTTSSTLYSGPLNVTGPPPGYGVNTEYVGAVAVQNGTSSAVATAGYTLSGDSFGLLQAATTASQVYGVVYQDGSESYPFLVPDAVVGGSSSVTLLLTNVGAAIITGQTALSATPSGPFAASTGGSDPDDGAAASCNFVTGLPGGSAQAGSTTTCTETVTFAPTTGGTGTGSIAIEVAGASNAPLTIFFSGNGIATGGAGDPSNAIPDAETPVALAITAGEQAVALNNDGSLLVIDGTTDKQDANCAAPSLVGSGLSILANPSLNQIYAVFGDSGSSPLELGVESIAANGASCTPKSGQAPGQFSTPPSLLAYDTYKGTSYVYAVLPTGGGNLDQIEIVNLSTGAMTSTTLGYSASYLWIAVDPASHLVFVGSNGGGSPTAAVLYEVSPFATGGPVSVGYNTGPTGPDSSSGVIFSQNGFVAPNPSNSNYGELFLVGGMNSASAQGTASFLVMQLDISQFPALPAQTTTEVATVPASALIFNESAGLNSGEVPGASAIDLLNKIVYAEISSTSPSGTSVVIESFNFSTQEIGSVPTEIPSGTSVTQLVFDAADDFLYWTSTSGATTIINEFQLKDGTAPITLFTGTASDLTVDQINGKLYAIDGSNILIFDPPAGTSLGTFIFCPTMSGNASTAGSAFSLTVSDSCSGSSDLMTNLEKVSVDSNISIMPLAAKASAAKPSTLSADTFTDTIHFTSRDPRAVLPPDYTYTAADNGSHTFSFTLFTAGSRTITFVDTTNASITGTTTVAVAPDTSSATIAATAGTAQSALTGAAYGTALAATIADKYANPISDVSVTFAAPTTGASGTFFGGDATATVNTGNNGIATAPAFTANGTAGGFQVTATGSGVGGMADFNLTNTAPSLIATTTALSGPTTLAYGATGAFTATVTAASGTAKPAGSIAYTVTSGSTAAGSGNLMLASGTASIPINGLAPGTYTVSAIYTPASVSGFASSQGAAMFTITQLGTTIVLTASPASGAYGTSFALSAAVKPSSGAAVPVGSVTFSSGTTVLGTATLNSSGVANYSAGSLAVGADAITAMYAGNIDFAGSTSAATSVTISPIATTTTLASSSATAQSGANVSFTATVAASSGSTAPTGTVTFDDGGTLLGSSTVNSSGAATYSTSSLAVGTHTITASYGGDSIHAASTSSTFIETITSAITPGWSMVVNPQSLTIAQGQTGTAVFTVTSVGGYDQPVNFTCSDLPAYAVCAFNPPTVIPSSGGVSSTWSVKTDVVDASVRPDLVPRRPGSARPLISLAGTGLAGLAMLLGLRGRKRLLGLHRWSALLIGVALTGFVAAWMTGCGSGGGPKTPIGTDTVTISATSGSGSAAINQTVKLQVTITQ